MIAFRADANAEIGTGHIMRCIAIAKELISLGEEPLFITADEYPASLLEREGLPYTVLKTDWRHMEDELEVLLPIITKHRVSCVVADSYYVTSRYLEKLKESAVTAYIDDFESFVYPADILINYNILCDIPAYEKMYEGSMVRLLLGTAFVPLREEFKNVKRIHIRETLSTVLITTGGADPCDFTYSAVERILSDAELKDIQLVAVAGSYYSNIEKLRALSRAYPGLVIRENVSSMSELMRACDAAVSASGTTLYELCVCGVPSVIFSFADNQLRLCESFGQNGMIACGDLRNRKEQCIDEVIMALKTLKGAEKRAALRDRLTLFDGRGAARLAAYIYYLTLNISNSAKK